MTLFLFESNGRPKTPLSDKTLRRVKALRQGNSSGYHTIAACETPQGQGAVAYRSTQGWGPNATSTTKVAFFDGAGIRRPISSADFSESAHAILGLPAALDAALAATRAQKKAPHPFVVGDVLSETWGATLQGARFYRVVAVPTERTIDIASLPNIIHSGDWQNGSVMPELDATEGPVLRCTVSMAKGQPKVRTERGAMRAEKWNGKPVSVWSD